MNMAGWESVLGLWPPPGLATGVLGLIAILAVLFPPQKGSAKILVIVMCVALIVADIVVITHDTRRVETKYEREVKDILDHFTQIEVTLDARQLALARVEAARTRPANSLKKRAFDLSSDVLQFLVSRQIAPGDCQTGFGEEPNSGQATVNERNCERETLGMYSNRFGLRVAAIRDALAKKALVDEELDAEYQAPASANSIRLIAEHIGALAEKLPR